VDIKIKKKCKIPDCSMPDEGWTITDRAAGTEFPIDIWQREE
jgi:hypothetical protein